MKVTQWYLWAVAAALALMVAGCSSTTTPEPTPPTPPNPTSVTLPGDHTLVAGELKVAAGKTKIRGGVVFSCDADGDDCVITIVDDLGLLVASAMGGDVTARAEPKPPEYPLGLPPGHSLGTGTITVKAGVTQSVGGGVDIKCPADGAACTITVSKNLGVISATSTGGQAKAEPTPMNVDLPPGSGELVAGTVIDVSAGGSVDEKGVKFACSDDLACVVTVAADRSATSTGGTVRATQISPLGHIATANFGAKVRAGTIDEVEQDTTDKDEMPAGMTLSSTTHEADKNDPDLQAGINDMIVKVTPKEIDSSADPTIIYTGGAEGSNLVVTRTVGFTTDGTWSDNQNEADEWSVTSSEFNATGADTIWGHSESEALTEDEAGGRTVHLDIYSDFDNAKQKLVSKAKETELGTGTAEDPVLKVRWQDTITNVDGTDVTTENTSWLFGVKKIESATQEITIPANVIRFDNINYVSPDNLETGERQELKPEPQDAANDPAGATIAGTWKGIPGTYSCAGATGGNGNCFIRNQQGSVTAGGEFRFKPDPKAMVVDRDTDWLAVGVWMTVPDDPKGDYAVGAFVRGSYGYQSAIIDLKGKATYEGEAVGRYAEKANNGLETSGRFSADANLTADFTNKVVKGNLTGFDVRPVMSDGALSNSITKRDWTLQLQNADSSKGPDFSNEASGHAQGHVLDGIWAGQFFGPSAKSAPTGKKDADGKDIMAPQQSPSAIAGTFAASESDRDAPDVYSLSLIGAFGAEYKKLTPDPQD